LSNKSAKYCEARKILFLEPTRFLVEQISKYISKVSNIEATPIHGVFSREMKERRDGEKALLQ